MPMTHPDFGDKQLELRCENREVCIYATEVGLRKLIALCGTLLDRPQIGHIHLEDHDLLTNGSLKGTVAIFTTTK